MSIKERFLQACREHSWLGVEYILKGGLGKSYIPLGRVHREINKVIDKVKEEARKVELGLLKPHEAKIGALIQIPRDHGKSALALARVLWELGKNPNLLIKIVCASEEQAKKRIAFLRQHIEQNKNLKELFPHLRPHPNLSWSTTQLFVDRSLISVDPSVEACGVLGTHTGSHC
ncbi:MAG TPA: hypothetical protein ENF94_00965, partial [Candidatus Woesearchaeota archaeon]|nr:hypothetical protein [Candidatus Woesearchaeota archaeon]